MVTRELIRALAAVHQRAPREVWQRLLANASGQRGIVQSASASAWVSAVPNPDLQWQLTQTVTRTTELSWEQLAAAATTVDCLAEGSAPPTELIWTGPPNGRFPVKRIDQALYDMIANASNRILLVTFAAHKVKHLCDHLAAAVRRGVSLTLIVEAEEESEGQLTKDAMNAFASLPKETLRVLYWPRDRRERNAAGRPGKLHAKCAVVDNAALIGSANLTDDAFNRNMELGVFIRDRPLVDSLIAHFEELIHRQELLKVT